MAKQTKKGKKQDKQIKAKHEGKRVSEKGAKNQFGKTKGGNTYYENRTNRSDKNRTKKLASGGSLQSMTTRQLADKAGVSMEDMERDNLHRDDLIAMITEGNYKKGGQTKAGKNQDKHIKAKKEGKRISEETGDVYYESRPNRSDKDQRKKLEEGGTTSSEKSYEDLVNGKLDSNGEISCDEFKSIIGREPCYPVCHVGASKYRKQFLRGCYRKMGGSV